MAFEGMKPLAGQRERNDDVIPRTVGDEDLAYFPIDAPGPTVREIREARYEFGL